MIICYSYLHGIAKTIAVKGKFVIKWLYKQIVSIDVVQASFAFHCLAIGTL